MSWSGYTVSQLNEQNYVVLFYNPWSDTALLTHWQYTNNRFGINHVQLVLGDYIRQYGQAPFELQPLWERKAATLTSPLSIPLAVGETLAAFGNIYPFIGKTGGGPAFSRQRKSFDTNLRNKSFSKDMAAAANLRFERIVTGLVRYEQDKPFEAYRYATSSLLADIKRNNLKDLKDTIPQTAQQTIDFIRANNKKVTLFKVVAVLKTPHDCFVHLSHPLDPNTVLIFWFQTDKDRYGLRQASFINHIFSTSSVDLIQELATTVSQR